MRWVITFARLPARAAYKLYLVGVENEASGAKLDVSPRLTHHCSAPAGREPHSAPQPSEICSSCRSAFLFGSQPPSL